MRHRTRIKICGVTHPADAGAAAEFADAIGLVFHPPAPRNVPIEVAESIVRGLPPFVTPVGLFVDQPAPVILETARRLNLRHVQLHGDEPPELLGALRGLSVVKAIKVAPGRFADDLRRWRGDAPGGSPPGLSGVVLETAGTKEAGGTGVENDWEAIRAELGAAGNGGRGPKIILAGGLTPRNVGRLVRLLRPWAVDVSSGVEETKGRKSVEKMEAFVNAVREADAG